ncbi:hypothetical protein CCACVL1_24067 [Corchorus capsularis]|uniref:DUF1664 domain-containing protein n=1 Tax=Corchorus capsularis TaxID=210143 RepID=A0A1R3GR51_COCAP|nr:hypothetical protein CCACVL1_24067 [Corchorus capsularis]
MPSASDVVSGAFKLFRQLKHDDTPKSVNKSQNALMMAQVNKLREDMQLIRANSPITIVTGRGSGTSKYTIIIVIVAAGYGYVWWKTTRRHLSSRIDSVDNRLDEIADVTAATRDEVTLLQDKSKLLNSNVQTVRHVVKSLESKINRIEGKQDITTKGVSWLCDFAQTMEQNSSADRIQASPASSSRQALEAPMKTPSRTGSLPPILPVELPSSDSNGTHKVKKSPRPVDFSESSSHEVTNGNRTPEDKTNGSSSSGLLGGVFAGRSAFLTRTRSATNAVPQEMRSSRQQ